MTTTCRWSMTFLAVGLALTLTIPSGPAMAATDRVAVPSPTTGDSAPLPPEWRRETEVSRSAMGPSAPSTTASTTPHGTALLRAHQARLGKKFAEARAGFHALASQRQVPTAVRREAGYWMGYCAVMLKDYVQAIRDFRWFLDAFGNRDEPYRVDALYVLARTYEVIGDPKAAEYYYRKCLREAPAPEHPFARKAREGLERIEPMLDQIRRKPLSAAAAALPGLADTSTAGRGSGSGNGRHQGDRAGAGSRQSADPTTTGSRDPFSRKPLTGPQYARIRGLTDRISQRVPLAQATAELTPEDLQLPMVKHLIATYQDWLQRNPPTPPAGATPGAAPGATTQTGSH